MLQDIYPQRLNNQYDCVKPTADSRVFFFKDRTVLLSFKDDGVISVPTYDEISQGAESLKIEYIYLFRVDKTNYFLAMTHCRLSMSGYEYKNVTILRSIISQEICFAGATAFHLFNWYRSNRFCGSCGKPLTPDTKERMFRCKNCNNLVFPKISPAVIVAIKNKDKLLMTKYAGREYTNYALVAGFTEIGETVEETVAREVMEEVGLKVKNIRYYKSQPWGFDSNLLLGFVADLDGDDMINLDTEELSLAQWFNREDIPISDDGVSLTKALIGAFKDNKI